MKLKTNSEIWNNKEIVKHYNKKNELFLSEKFLINKFKKDMSEWKMLDIGIGTGRTTIHFANLVKEYIGIDYSENMINECKRNAILNKMPINIMHADITQENLFPSNYFNFILFSYNGIDYLNEKERTDLFYEIRKIGKINGYFYFSSHNLNGSFSGFKKEYTFSKIHKTIYQILFERIRQKKLRI